MRDASHFFQNQFRGRRVPVCILIKKALQFSLNLNSLCLPGRASGFSNGLEILLRLAAMKSGAYTGVEVPCCTTIEESWDLVNVHEIIKLGEKAARAKLPELKRAVSWTRRLRRSIYGNPK